MVNLLNRLGIRLDPGCWVFFKWSVMAAAIFWALVYAESRESENLPNFVYVNF